MADLAHVFGNDLQVGPTGDLALVSGTDEAQQRILHRLLTSASTYIWQLSYGAGLPGLVGSVRSAQQITAVIRAQLAVETSVATTPEPQITITSAGIGTIMATITYTDQQTGSTQVLALPLGG